HRRSRLGRSRRRLARMRRPAGSSDQAARIPLGARGDRGLPACGAWRRGRRRAGGRAWRPAPPPGRRRRRDQRRVPAAARGASAHPVHQDRAGRVAARLRTPAPRPAHAGVAADDQRQGRPARASRDAGVTPYVDFSYFLFLLYPLAALLVLGGFGLLRRPVVLVVSVAIVLFQYANPLGVNAPAGAGLGQLAFLLAYVAAGTGVVLAYARIRTRHPAQAIFYGAIALVLAPLVVVKLAPLAHGVFRSSPVGGAHPLAAVPSVVSPSATGFLDTFGFLGISYMTLRVIDTIIVRPAGLIRGPPRAADVVSYVLFAPTISAGPIDRSHRYITALDGLPRTRRDYLRDIEAGIDRIAQGFLY